MLASNDVARGQLYQPPAARPVRHIYMARGRRVEWKLGMVSTDLAAGDYVRPKPEVNPNDVDTWWIFRTPSGNAGRINPEWHRVYEFRNGTITVDPSLHFDGEECDWLLTRGIWSAHRRKK